MKRFIINKKLKNSIKNNNYSMRELSKILCFQVKNILYNKSINEEHLNKLSSFLNMNFKLKEFNFDYAKNFGITQKPIKKNISKSKELAEFIGIMLGDGNICKNQMVVCFDKRNKKYISYVKEKCKKLFGIDLKYRYLKNTNAAYLYYYNKELIERLINFGLKRGNKIKNQIRIPEWIKQNEAYSKMCIRGLIDTDGSIYVCKREKQKYISFTNFNQQLLNDFKEQTKKLGYSFANSSRQHDACLYRKNEVVRFINDIKPQKAIYGVVCQLGKRLTSKKLPPLG